MLDISRLCEKELIITYIRKVNSIVSLLFCSILRNNSFSGIIPKEIRELKKLEVLDLGQNRFSGALPSDLNSNLRLSVL